MKYVWYLPKKSKFSFFPLREKLNFFLVTSHYFRLAFSGYMYNIGFKRSVHVGNGFNVILGNGLKEIYRLKTA